jgi:SAM-dependent methyltransferase
MFSQLLLPSPCLEVGEPKLAFREVELEFENLDQWLSWCRSIDWVFDPEYITTVVEAVRQHGFIDPGFGLLSGNEVEIRGTNYRETLVARGLNCRLRAVMAHTLDFALAFGRDIQVYAPEAVTPFATRLRELFPGFKGSEYLPTKEARSKLRAHLLVEHQDVQALNYADHTFDLYLSPEILEHVPSIPDTLMEAKRVLRPAGALISTFPFHYKSEQTTVTARLTEGGIVHLEAPCYHENPADPEGGSLVFAIPGWDILKLCEKAGFSRCRMIFQSSRRLGVVGSEIAGVFVLIAKS